jgi:hypothetical protein
MTSLLRFPALGAWVGGAGRLEEVVVGGGGRGFKLMKIHEVVLLFAPYL